MSHDTDQGRQSTRLISDTARKVVGFVFSVVLLAACSFPGSVKPTVKVGLSAPFEGLYRDLGYEAGDLPATEAAAREVLSLPLYPELREEEVAAVSDAVIAFSRAAR